MVTEKRLFLGATLKYFDVFDVALLKLCLIAFALFLVSVWPAFANWVVNTSWVWFLVAFIVFAIRPIIKGFKK